MSNKKYTEFSLWLKKKREEAGLSKASLAEKAGVSAAYIGQLENMTEDKKKNITKPTLESLKRALEVNSDYQEGRSVPDGGSRTQEGIDKYGAEVRPPSGFVLIPRYNVEASAGGGAVVSDEQVIDRLAFREEWVRHALGVKPQDLALVTTIGDSMEPTLHPGDVVMLDMSVTQIQNNALYALQVNGSLLVKRVQRMMDGRVIIRSDNDLYEPETISTDMADSIKVVGRIVWAGRKF